MSKRAIVIPLIVLVVAALLFLAIFGRWTSWFGDRAEQETDDAYVQADMTPLSTRISGTVRKMEVNDFDSVKAGQVLVEIDDEDYRSIVAEAKAALAASQAALEDNQASKKIQEAKGDNVTQAMLTQRFTTSALAGIFLVRFAIGPWSYAAGCPGGLFAPMLAVGASFGALFGELLNHFLPTLGITPFACAVVGMATLFTACVRAPLTGVVLAMEMTGRGDLTLPLLSASLMAMLITMVVDSEPIYETLKRRMFERQKGERSVAPRRVGIELSH